MFYSDNFGNQLNRAVTAITAAHLTDIGDSARLFALANIAAADALINAWKNKRFYNFWRPSTAIHGGRQRRQRQDGRQIRAGCRSSTIPPYPDYTSGANSITSAFMRTLEHYFGDGAFTFNVTSNVAAVVQKTRTYERFSDVAADVVEARILLGIHFRFADVVARRQGKQAADQVFSHVLRPFD